MKNSQIVKLFALTLSSALTCAMPANATVTAYFSLGASCKGVASKDFSARESIQVSLCVTTTVESLCGSTIRLEVDSPGESGHFQVTGRTLGKNYPDPNNETLAAAISIEDSKLTRLDFGGTRDDPLPPAADQLLATFTLSAQSEAKNPKYAIRLGKNSVVSVAKTRTCDPTEPVPISATLSLTKK